MVWASSVMPSPQGKITESLLLGCKLSQGPEMGRFEELRMDFGHTKN